MKYNNDLSAEYVRSILSYDPSTGVFIRKFRPDMRPTWNGRFAGKVAGTSDDEGYIKIRVDGKKYGAHRLACLHFYGEWPPFEVDHKDLQPSNNRIDNLRLATRSQNGANRVAQLRSRVGVKGVYQTKYGKYLAYIKKDGKRHYLGSYATVEGAGQAYASAARILHDQFART